MLLHILGFFLSLDQSVILFTDIPKCSKDCYGCQRIESDYHVDEL